MASTILLGLNVKLKSSGLNSSLKSQKEYDSRAYKTSVKLVIPNLNLKFHTFESKTPYPPY